MKTTSECLLIVEEIYILPRDRPDVINCYLIMIKLNDYITKQLHKLNWDCTALPLP